MTNGSAFPGLPTTGEALSSSPAWWTASSQQSSMAAGATHGRLWGAVPPHSLGPDASMNHGWSPNLLECNMDIHANMSDDPAAIYTFEDFTADQNILDSFAGRIEAKLKAKMACLEKFSEGVIEVFGNEYLRRPTTEDIEHLIQVNESRGFPGMLGSIDCMRWQWENCLTAWKGQYTNGKYGFPTIILEAVASHDLWIWHAFFGVAGSNNNINVLNQSPLFTETIKGEAPQVQFTVSGTQYDTGYYLADGIYPEWATFVKSIRAPQLEKHKAYAKEQEGVRKDVERAFGVLQARFNIVRRPARLWNLKTIGNIIKACIILHNIIVEDEGDMAQHNIDLNDAPGVSIVLPPEVEKGSNSDPCFDDVRCRNAAVRARPIHSQLKNDLIEHIWQRSQNNAHMRQRQNH